MLQFSNTYKYRSGILEINKSAVCGLPSCSNVGVKLCSGCFKKVYCCAECKKADWKKHRISCPYKKDSDRLISFDKIKVVVNDLRTLVMVKQETRKEKIVKTLIFFAADWRNIER